MVLTNEAKKLIFDKAYNENSTYGVPKKFSVGTGTNTPTENDTQLQNEVQIQSGVYKKDFVSGYPIIDLTKKEVKFRMFLNSLEANGNQLSEVGIWENGQNKLFSRNTFEPQNKTSAVEISIIKKDWWRE